MIETTIDEVAHKTTHGLDHLEPRRKHRWPDLYADEEDIDWARDVFGQIDHSEAHGQQRQTKE